ncbi:MAG TPA: hypothetical protein VE944_08390 [Nostoc sp.]|nr:hypothetical protein [Nostoc sp.]HYX14373.1 hypothetical protein [Nostoc sp.]
MAVYPLASPASPAYPNRIGVGGIGVAFRREERKKPSELDLIDSS